MPTQDFTEVLIISTICFPIIFKRSIQRVLDLYITIITISSFLTRNEGSLILLKNEVAGFIFQPVLGEMDNACF